MTSPAPVLSDGVVTLRNHIDADIDPMVEMCRDPEMVRWTSVPQPYHRENAVHYVRSIVQAGWERDHRGWAIEAVDDDGAPRFAGNIDVRGVPIADVGYALHTWARGRGIMQRAMRLASRWAFDEGGVEVVHWRAHVGNIASRRSAWRAGFSFHATIPRLLHERGRTIDAWVGSLLPDATGEPVTTWLEPVELRGEVATLRGFRETDVDRIVEACDDERSRHWLAGLPKPYTADDARTYILGRVVAHSMGSGLFWAIADPVDGRLIGNIGIMDLAGSADPTSGEIGYWMHPDGRGRGVMSEALRLVVDHALVPKVRGGLGLRRLALAAGVANSASRHVIQQAGFVEVGRHRLQDPLGDSTFTDLVWYDLLADDRRP